MPQFHPSNSLLLLLLQVAILEGWAFTPPTTAQTLRIGVPEHSICSKYVRVKCNQTASKCFDGFSIQLFELILERINYKMPYQFFPYHGSYDSLVEQVSLKLRLYLPKSMPWRFDDSVAIHEGPVINQYANMSVDPSSSSSPSNSTTSDTVFFTPTSEKTFDAVVGDVSIVANRTEYVDFSRFYTEMGVRMVVLEKPGAGNAWMFVKPFTKSMWALTIAIFLYNSLIVWLIEKSGNEELEGLSCWSQFGSLVWLSFTTLFPINGEKLRSSLSRVTMVVWLFVALVLTQSYTANLTSMLTVQQLRPSVVDVGTLQRSTYKVGCSHGSFLKSYLENVLHFNKSRIKTYLSGKEYAQDLRSGEIETGFQELAFIKIFLDENKGFVATGPIYEIGGYGFAFSKGSALVGNVSDEILRLRESGELRKLEEHLLVSSPSNSSGSDTDAQESGRLSPDSFWGLFLITGGTSTLVFLLFLASRFHDKQRRKKPHQNQQVPERDHAINLALPKRAPHMVMASAVHDPDWWHNKIQLRKFGRSNTL